MPCSVCRKSGHNRLTCPIAKTTPPRTYDTQKHNKSRGKNCLRSGVSYEQSIRTKLSGLSYDELPIHIGRSGGATTNPDIPLRIGNKKVNIEVKNKGSFEAGGKSMKIQNNKLMCPNGTLHHDILGDRVPWSGHIPSFIKRDKSLDTWNCEKTTFRDEYHRISPDVIRSYYNRKGVDYIQIEGKGLYHTGNDILCLGVPLFDCRGRMRIRYKQHGSTPMPSSVQAVFTFDRRSLEMSKYDIDNKLPNVFNINKKLK